MFSIDSTDNTIKLTRGDTARLAITIKNDLTGDDYEILSNDTLRLTIKKQFPTLTRRYKK